MAKRALYLALCLLLVLGIDAASGCGLDWDVPPTEGEGGRNSGHASAGPGGLVLPTSDGSSVTAASSGDAASGGNGGAGGGSVASSGTGSVSCDVAGPDCDTCANCSVGRGCFVPYDDCQNDYSCFYLQECLYSCSENDAVCIDNCWYDWEAGANLYTYAIQCIVCGDCATTCAAYSADWGC